MIAVDTLYAFEYDEICDKRIRRSFGICIAEILDGLSEIGLEKEFCLIVSDDAEQFVRERFPKYKIMVLKWWLVDLLRFIHSGKKRHIGEFFKRGYYSKFIDENNFDAILFPFALPGQVANCKTVKMITVFDLMLFHRSNSKAEIAKYAEMVEEADHIVAISDYVKNDIAKSFNVNQTKLSTVPCSIKVDVSEEEKPANLDKEYILDINGYGKHKNAITLIKAYEKIASKIKLDLAFCGGWSEDDYFQMLKDYVKEHNLDERVHFYFQVSDKERNYLLKHASLFVTPSTDEGFGRTPVEAAICKIPVISTREAALNEATMGLVNYYNNPVDDDELAQVILNTLSKKQSDAEKQMIADKLEHAYAATTCAQMYWDILQKLIKNTK